MPRRATMAARRWASMSNMCRRTRPANARRPLPRRGGGRRAGGAAQYSGHKVTREYYVELARRSMCSRARSTCAAPRGAGRRYRGDPRGLYPGDYLKPVAEKLAAEYGDRYVRRARKRVARPVPRRGGERDDGHDAPTSPSWASIMISSRRRPAAGRGQARRRKWLRERNWSMTVCSKRRRARRPS